MRKVFLITNVVLLLSLNACTTTTPEPTVTKIPEEASATSPPATQSPAPAHPASGLVFTNADGTWWIDRAGEIQLLINEHADLLSADGKLIIYTDADPVTYMSDLWILDRDTGKRRNLTETPDRAEVGPAWLGNSNDRLIFGSDTDEGMGSNNFPTIVSIDGSGYRVLDTQVGGLRGVSPYGEFLYGDVDGTFWIGNISSNGTVFDPTLFGVKIEKSFIATWSPDGRYLAWYVRGDLTEHGQSTLAIVVFDLPTNSAQVIHPYNPVGGSAFANELAWSPDGDWLAFTTRGEPSTSGRGPSVWVIQPDGSSETNLGIGASLQWRYDSQYLAFYALNEAETEELYLAQAGSWETARVEDLLLPERIGRLVDWQLDD